MEPFVFKEHLLKVGLGGAIVVGRCVCGEVVGYTSLYELLVAKCHETVEGR